MIAKRSYGKFIKRIDSIGLLKGAESRCRAFHISLRDLYEGQGRTPSIASARRAVYRWLRDGGKSINEIARLFDRAPSGIMKMTRAPGP